KLKEEIRKLNNRLLIGEWKVMHLHNHRHFKLVPNLELSLEHKKTNLTHPTKFWRLIVRSGFYRIKPKLSLEPFLVFCDLEDGGGWTVIQKWTNGKKVNGFGHFQSRKDEFWLGSDHIHALLSDGENVMKIELMDWKGERSYAMYDNFRVSDEKAALRNIQWSGRRCLLFCTLNTVSYVTCCLGLWYSLRRTATKVRPSSYMDNLGSGGGPTE
uniref:Si:ch211-287a12.9 n=1 Tax=Sinocyclocheilus grahami TaxID=75366 RepID=A0A672REL8_SINGR